MEVIGSTMISKERLEEIKNFENKNFSDCPVLTEEQLKDMKPSHLLSRIQKKHTEFLRFKL